MCMCILDHNNDPVHLHNRPAVIDINLNGKIKYYSFSLNGKRHRINGPALYLKGIRYYYLHDKEYSKAEYYLRLVELP